jgi:hypothetical protein
VTDLVMLLTPLLVLPVVLFFAFLGCHLVAPFDVERLLLRVEVRFPPPPDVNVSDLRVNVEFSGRTLDGDVFGDFDENHALEVQDNGWLVSISEFPSTSEGSYSIVCNVYDLNGSPIFRSSGCNVDLLSANGDSTIVHFAPEEGDRLTCRVA